MRQQHQKSVDPTSVISIPQQASSLQIYLLKKQNRFDGLDSWKIFGYGVGHVVNDLTAACWFNYLFFFLRTVVRTPAAASALLAGQIADGIATPIIGYLSDKTHTKYGQRTPWYIGGLILVILGYLPIYHKYHSQNRLYQYIYYLTFPSIFNIGWAAVQISHMSLVPSLTCSRKRRDILNNIRNTFTFISNFIVLGVGLLIFEFLRNGQKSYSLISYIVTGLGLCTSIFFLYQIRQASLTEQCNQKAQKLHFIVQSKKKQNDTLKKSSIVDGSVVFSEDQQIGGIRISKRQTMVSSVYQWFKMPKFYLFGICYMGVRLYTNIFGTFLPFYLLQVLEFDPNCKQDEISYVVALFPLIVYFSSVITSFTLNKFYIKFGRKLALVFGTVISLISLGTMFFLNSNNNWIMYIVAPFIGISQMMVLSTGINLISDVVGSKVKTGAFVFGIYSLLDKFSAGIVIFLIGNSEPYSKSRNQLELQDKKFIRYTMVLVPSIATLLATLIVITYPIKQYSSTSKKNKKQKQRNSFQSQFVQ